MKVQEVWVGQVMLRVSASDLGGGVIVDELTRSGQPSASRCRDSSVQEKDSGRFCNRRGVRMSPNRHIYTGERTERV